MELSSDFKDLLSSIQPGDQDVTDAKAAHEKVREQLRNDSEFKDAHKDTFLSGSYARHTAINDINDVDVICADLPSGTQAQSQQVARLMQYFGFEVFNGHEPLSVGERIHRFGENILISLTVFAQNAAALRLDTLSRVRVSIYLSRRTLEEKFRSGN